MDEEKDNYHIAPTNDLKDHILRGQWCWCQPVVELNAEWAHGIPLVIHNSQDGREFFEAGWTNGDGSKEGHILRKGTKSE